LLDILAKEEEKKEEEQKLVTLGPET